MKKIVSGDKNNDKDMVEKELKQTKYTSLTDKIFRLASLALLSFAFALIFLDHAIGHDDIKVINYNEKGTLDYKVNLKQNDFYDSKSLGKDMAYVASLINNINTNYNYDFNIDEESDIKFMYDIIGKLVITDSNGENTFFEKNYILQKKQLKYLKDDKKLNINGSINIDYNKYNDFANKFRSNYGLETKSNFIVYISVYKQGIGENVKRLNNDSNMSLTIPLSEKAVNITLDSKDINKNSKIYNTSGYKINNYIMLISAIFLFVLSIIVFIKLIIILVKNRGKKSHYEKYIKKILREYDRLIVETSSAPVEKNKNIIKVNDFSELLDVRDNLGLPIKYYIVTKKQKCNFYIDHNDELYLLVLKEIDFK